MSLIFLYKKIQSYQLKDPKKEREDCRKCGEIDLKCMFCPKSLKKIFESGDFDMGRSRHWKRQYFFVRPWFTEPENRTTTTKTLRSVFP